MEEQYVRYLSDFMEWDQLDHAAEWILHEENIGEYLSIDKTSLSQGEFYTIVTNKDARGQKGSIVAMVHGTDAETVSKVLEKIPLRKRRKVKEVTLDMAASMQKIVRQCFPKARQVTDRFHVQQLAFEALQELQIKHRWEVIDQENKEMDFCKKKIKHLSQIF